MFDLPKYLESRRAWVDAELDRWLPPEQTAPASLHQAMRYCVFPGGKRLRPILCLAAADTAGGESRDALPAAAAVELLHTYTLVHDDLPCMDDDDVRRGKPTAHVAFGEAAAVLTGDALQALAFEAAARAPVLPPYGANDLVAELAHAAGSLGVVGGQTEDIAAGGTTPSAAAIEFIHLHKTADLFRAALRMGAISAGAGQGALEALSRYGVNLGLAFQITDDLLDADNADRDETTCLAVDSPETARAKAETLLREAIEAVAREDLVQRDPLIAMANFVLERSS